MKLEARLRGYEALSIIAKYLQHLKMTKSRLVKIATAQVSVAKDIRNNGQKIRHLIETAASIGADLVHFCEGALSGYCKNQIQNFEDFNWRDLEDELILIRALCRELEIWSVIGSAHQLNQSERPRNSLYIINDQGELAYRYDKRFCSHSEISSWYSAGKAPVIFDVCGVRFGCAICIEVQFPEIFLEYEKLDVDCVLLSSYSDSSMFGIQAQGHAACYNYWISMSVPANMSDKLSSNFIAPNGDLIQSYERGENSLVINVIDPEDIRWEIPIKRARSWRRIARKGDIYV